MISLRHAMHSIRTDRLEILPVSPAIARADADGGDRARLRRLLGAGVPSDWPPELLSDHLEEFAEKLEANPLGSGVSPWVFIRDESDAADRMLIGSGGFMDQGDGALMVGYSLLPAYFGRGYATEAVSALIDWALLQDGVRTIFGDTFPNLPASIRVLEKCGFHLISAGSDPGALRFQLDRKRD